MNKIILILGILASSIVQAQIVDVLGSLGVQGAMTQQSTQSVGQGLSMMRRLQVLQDIQQVAMDIKTRYFGNYIGVSSASVSGQPFSGVDWSVAPMGSSQFFIQLNQIDQSTCSYLISAGIGALKTEVNGAGSQCVKSNQMRFIFD